MKYFLSVLFVMLLALPGSCDTLRVSQRQASQLQKIFQELDSGDTLILGRGHYELSTGLTLSDLTNVSILGDGQVTITIDNLDDEVLSIKNCERITIENLRLSHKKPSDEYQCEGAVIRVAGGKKIFLSRNWLNGCGAEGVYADKVEDLIVYKNKIFNNTFSALWLIDVSGSITENRIYDNANALITRGNCSITLMDNTINDNSGNPYSSTTFYNEMVGRKRH